MWHRSPAASHSPCRHYRLGIAAGLSIRCHELIRKRSRWQNTAGLCARPAILHPPSSDPIPGQPHPRSALAMRFCRQHAELALLGVSSHPDRDCRGPTDAQGWPAAASALRSPPSLFLVGMCAVPPCCAVHRLASLSACASCIYTTPPLPFRPNPCSTSPAPGASPGPGPRSGTRHHRSPLPHPTISLNQLTASPPHCITTSLHHHLTASPLHCITSLRHLTAPLHHTGHLAASSRCTTSPTCTATATATAATATAATAATTTATQPLPHSQ